jgi:hypothetical protein
MDLGGHPTLQQLCIGERIASFDDGNAYLLIPNLHRTSEADSNKVTKIGEECSAGCSFVKLIG